MAPSDTLGLRHSGEDDGRAGVERVKALVSDAAAQHADWLRTIEEALAASEGLRARAAEEADRLLAEARREAARLHAEAAADRDAAREERQRLAAARIEAEEALAHARHALAAITGPRTVPPEGDTPHAGVVDEPPSPVESAHTGDITARRAKWSRAFTRLAVAAGCLAALIVAAVLTRPALHPAVRSGPSPRPAARTSPSVPPISSRPVASPAPPSAPSIVITAARPTWMRLTVDGTPGEGFVLRPGAGRVIDARRELVVRAGDAGAVSVAIGNRPPVVMGRDGQVLTRAFSPTDQLTIVSTAGSAEPAREPPDQAAGLGAPLASKTSGSAAPAGPLAAAAPSALTGGDPGQSGRTPHPAVIAERAGALGQPRHDSTQLVPIELPGDVGTAASPGSRRSAATDGSPREANGLESADIAAGGTRAVPVSLSDDEQVRSAGIRWCEAYGRGDGATMGALSAPGFELLDERPSAARLTAPAAARVDRSLSDVRVSVSGEGAVLSARMLERVTDPAAPAERVSYVSQVWVRQAGTWRLLGVRLRTAEQVAGTFPAAR